MGFGQLALVILIGYQIPDRDQVKVDVRDSIRDAFVSRLKKVDINLQGTIDVPIYLDYHIRFTAKHLLQIQEILKRMRESIWS